MDGNRRNFFKKKGQPQFKRKGDHKRERWSNSSREAPYGNSQPADTVYRVLCPSRKIGGVIGKGGGIVKALREETQAKITVAESVPGSDERVIIIYSSPTKVSKNQNSDEDSGMENETELMQPHCAAQDALMRVHNRMVEEDGFGSVASDDESENNTVTVRLLVPNNLVGCVLGKGGDVIQRLRSETGAGIRVLPNAHLPTCALDTDELVQISGKPDVAKRALYEVSTLLHQNPRKDKPPSSNPAHFGAQGFHPGPPVTTMIPPGNPMWPHRNPISHGMPPMPLMGRYEDHRSGFVPGGFSEVSPRNGREAPAEFSMKILCSAGKIGGVIGKGGYNVRQLEQDTGAIIDVSEASIEMDERVIHISCLEAAWNPRSQTIDAILQLQSQTSEISEKGVFTTRLLVPSSKVGCIIGQGGNVINEMRRRTQADIRVFSKDDKPKCAAEDEELVQLSGNHGVAKEALAEIATRLRARTLRDSSAGAEPISVGPGQRFVPAGNFHPGGVPPVGTIGAGSSGGYEHFKGGRYEHEPQRHPIHAAATRYAPINDAYEPRIPNNSVGSVIGSGGSNISNISEVAGARVKHQDAQSGGSERVADIVGSSDHLTGAQTIHHAYMVSGGQNMAPQQGSYQDMNTQHGSYQSMNTQHDSYPSANHQSSYQNVSSQQGPYQNMSGQQGSYDNTSAHYGQQGSYDHTNAHYGAYSSVNAQQSPYSQQVTNTNAPYQNTGTEQGSYQY